MRFRGTDSRTCTDTATIHTKRTWTPIDSASFPRIRNPKRIGRSRIDIRTQSSPLTRARWKRLPRAPHKARGRRPLGMDRRCYTRTLDRSGSVPNVNAHSTQNVSLTLPSSTRSCERELPSQVSQPRADVSGKHRRLWRRGLAHAPHASAFSTSLNNSGDAHRWYGTLNSPPLFHRTRTTQTLGVRPSRQLSRPCTTRLFSSSTGSTQCNALPCSGSFRTQTAHIVGCYSLDMTPSRQQNYDAYVTTARR
mmetsp:Transcript_8741/g.17459  ORF Transcript_8741/g.17459 Transcript_8741/m.17459 type:complete len:250 (-) Transcript_8741:369-1118(-)